MRAFWIIIGFALLGIVGFLGIQAASDNRYIVWFGLAAALLAPGGIASISYAFSSGSRDTLARLERIPEIEKLIEEAKTQEEKIRLLEEERERLVEAIELETRKQALTARKDSLETDAVDILGELEAIDNELSTLDAEIEISSAQDAVQILNERLVARRRGDIVIRLGTRHFYLNRNLILSLPMGRFLLFNLQVAESLMRRK